MTKHLSARQIDECIAGKPGLEVEEHLRDCSRCRAEVAGIRDALGSFRQSVHAWSDELLGAGTSLQVTPARSWLSVPKLSLAILAAVVCLLIAVMGPWRQVRPTPAPVVSDAALLSQIDAEVSRTVPGPMEPLTEFVSNDSSITKKEARP